MCDGARCVSRYVSSQGEKCGKIPLSSLWAGMRLGDWLSLSCTATCQREVVSREKTHKSTSGKPTLLSPPACRLNTKAALK